jgi:hypothetical protein
MLAHGANRGYTQRTAPDESRRDDALGVRRNAGELRVHCQCVAPLGLIRDGSVATHGFTVG